MTMEQQVNIYLFSNFIITILVELCIYIYIIFFFVPILTVTKISNAANLTSVFSHHHSFAVPLLSLYYSMETQWTQ